MREQRDLLYPWPYTEGLAMDEAMRRRLAEHPIEQVGEKLRAMMPWIKANRLVDQSKN